MDVSPGTDMGMTREQETCLKSQLLKICVQDEITHFMEKPEDVDNTVFLSFLRAKILDFPLLAMREKAQSKMVELLDSLPKFLTVSQRATKHDTNNRKMRVIVVANYSSMLRTPLERMWDLRRIREDYTPEVDIKVVDDPAEMKRQELLGGLTKELARTSLAIFLEIESAGGVEKFFSVVKAHNNLSELPTLYQDFFKFFGKVLAVGMERQYSDPKHVHALKKLYRLTPVKAIRGILALTDPKKLLEGLLSIFLARPFGTHNLLQKMGAAGTELKHSQAQLKEAKITLMHDLHRLDATKLNNIFARLHQYAQQEPLPIVEEEDFVGRPHGEEIVDYDRLVPSQLVLHVLFDSNVLNKHDIDSLTEAEINSVRMVLVYEMRVKDKSDFVELLGTQDTTTMMREIFPIFYEIVCTIKKADFGHYFERYFKAMKTIVKVSEASKGQDTTARVAAYEAALEEMQKDLYSFIHSVFVNDTGGEVYKTFEWYIEMLRFVHRREAVDVQRLLVPLSPADRALVVREMDSVLAYYKHVDDVGAPPAARPVCTKTRVLAPAFVEMMSTRLHTAPRTHTHTHTQQDMLLSQQHQQMQQVEAKMGDAHPSIGGHPVA